MYLGLSKEIRNVQASVETKVYGAHNPATAGEAESLGCNGEVRLP